MQFKWYEFFLFLYIIFFHTLSCMLTLSERKIINCTFGSRNVYMLHVQSINTTKVQIFPLHANGYGISRVRGHSTSSKHIITLSLYYDYGKLCFIENTEWDSTDWLQTCIASFLLWKNRMLPYKTPHKINPESNTVILNFIVSCNTNYKIVSNKYIEYDEMEFYPAFPLHGLVWSPIDSDL